MEKEQNQEVTDEQLLEQLSKMDFAEDEPPEVNDQDQEEQQAASEDESQENREEQGEDKSAEESAPEVKTDIVALAEQVKAAKLQAAREKDREIAKLREELERAKAPADQTPEPPKDLRSLILTNPDAVAQELGVTTADLAKHFYYATLGDEAPDEFKTAKSTYEVKSTVSSEVAALREELAELKARESEREQQRAVESEMQMAKRKIKEYFDGGPEGVNYLANMAKVDPDQAAKAILDAAVAYSEAHGEDPTIPQAVKFLETRLAKQIQVLTGQKTEKSEEPKSTQTLKNRMGASTKTRDFKTEEEKDAWLLAQLQEGNF